MPVIFHATTNITRKLEGMLYPLDCYHDGIISFIEITSFSLAFSVTHEQWDLAGVGLLTIEYKGKECLGFDFRFFVEILLSLREINMRINQFYTNMERKIDVFS